MKPLNFLFIFACIMAHCRHGNNAKIEKRAHVSPVYRPSSQRQVYEAHPNEQLSLNQQKQHFASRAPAPELKSTEEEDMEQLTEYVRSHLHNSSNYEGEIIRPSTYRPVTIKSYEHLPENPVYTGFVSAPKPLDRSPVYYPVDETYSRNISAILEPMTMFYGMAVNKKKNSPVYVDPDLVETQVEVDSALLSIRNVADQSPTAITERLRNPTPINQVFYYKPSTRAPNGLGMGLFASREREEDPRFVTSRTPSFLRHQSAKLSVTNTASFGEDNVVPVYNPLNAPDDPLSISKSRASLRNPNKNSTPRYATIGQYMRVPEEYLNQPSLTGSIPGEPGVDYPVYELPPPTSFLCASQSYPGYYADIEAQCQVFHICQADGRAHAFICPEGTLFHQQFFVCDWWYNVDCDQAPSYYSLNTQLFDRPLG